MTPDELRKTPGCWACEHGKACLDGNDPELSCVHPNAAIRDGFQGDSTALTCTGFRMKSCDLLYNAGEVGPNES